MELACPWQNIFKYGRLMFVDCDNDVNYAAAFLLLLSLWCLDTYSFDDVLMAGARRGVKCYRCEDAIYHK